MRFFLFALSLVVMFIVSYLIWGDYFEQLLKGDEAATYIRSFGALAWLVAIALFVTDVALPIPATAILATLGIVYGPFWGGVIGCLGTFAAGSVAYLICYALGENAAIRLVGDRGLSRGRAFFDRAGGWTVALSRWMIILPELISCLAGLTRMPPRKYFAALACGVVPMSFTYAYIGWARSDKPVLAIALSAAVPVLLWPIAQMMVNRRAKAKGAPPEDTVAAE